MQYSPYAYQQYAEEYIMDHPYAGVFLDMGMGKTAITLTAIDTLIYDLFEVEKVLVIAPLEPAQNTWPKEIEKWEHLKRLSYVSLLGEKKEREQALARDVNIYIINREKVPWLVDTLGARWPFDMVVIDELSSFKSPKALRFKKLKAVRKYINRIVGLTGTPTPNGLLDLWAQVFLLDGGQALSRSITRYREAYFEPDKRNATTIFSWKLKPGAEDVIYKKIEGFCFSLKSEDYLTLPQRLDIRHFVTLPKAAMGQYKQMERDMILSFESGDVDAGTAAILANKLLQFAGGAAYDEFGNVQSIHEAKLLALEELIEEANGQPVLVFYNYKHELERIQQRFPHASCVKGSPDIIEKWNDGKVPILLAHPQSAGHGLNLQFGGHIIIWFGLPWSLENFQQANKRLHRLGQKEIVRIYYLLAKGTIDERVLDVALAEKEQTQAALLEAVCRQV